MKELIHVLNTNSVMKNGLQFTVDALLDGIWQGCETGFPTLVSHDHSRVIGWTIPLALHIESGMARSVSLTNLVENSSEAKLINQYKLAFDSKVVAQKQHVIDNLRSLLSDYLVAKGLIVHYPQVALFETDLAVKAFPKVFALADRDGLIPLCELNPIGPGVFKIDEYIIFAHEYFRRALFRINTLNAEFLSQLQEVDENLNPRIALDPNMVGLADDYFPPVELMYVWGPTFDNDLTKINPGVTVHQANDDVEVFFSGVLRTEFWWKSKSDYKEFEVEEIVDRDHPHYRGEKQFGCRYCHSMVKEETGVSTHLDGSIRMYSEEKMVERLDKAINKAGKHSLYTKLWRVDGDIDIVTWKTLVSSYFRDNTLIGEYLGGVNNNPYLTNPSTSDLPLQNHKYEYVPYAMKAGDGLRLSISYHQTDAVQLSNEFTHEFRSTDYMVYGEERMNILDSRIIDLHKLLTQSGAVMQTLDEFTIVKYQDGYVNFPTIIHKGEDLQDSFVLTQEIIKTILGRWYDKQIDIVIAYSLGFVIENRLVFVSIMGHLNDLWEWTQLPISRIPIEKNQLDEWASQVTKHLEEKYDISHNCPALENTLMYTGLLSIQRRSPENLNYEYIMEENGLRIQVDTSSLSEDAFELLRQGQIYLSSGFIINSMICSNCDSEYARCNCISITTDNIAQRIDKCIPLYPHWTDIYNT